MPLGQRVEAVPQSEHSHPQRGTLLEIPTCKTFGGGTSHRVTKLEAEEAGGPCHAVNLVAHLDLVTLATHSDHTAREVHSSTMRENDVQKEEVTLWHMVGGRVDFHE